MSQGELEKRFSHFLQPIRDLTKNWEVDVAAELREYLQEIETIKISFDGGATTMNFAEAALLIQGSACVYSKKVEYLYSLVYQTLDLLANRRKQQLPSSIDKEGNDKDVSVAGRNADQEFLLLDDIQDSNNVNMKTTDQNDNMIQLMVQTPTSLQKLDDIGKDIPLLSRKGEMLGNHGDFRFNTGSILPSGLLLMDVAQLSNLEDALTNVPQSTPLFLANTNLNEFAGEPVEDNGLNIPEAGHLPESHDISLDDVEMGDPMENSFHEQEDLIVNRMQLRTREHQPIKIVPTKFVDPWQLQDPHDGDAVLQKSFRKANPYKVPAKLETGKKRKRKNTQEKCLLPLTEYISQSYNAYSNKLPCSILKRPTFRELEYLYWQEFRRQQQFLKDEKKTLARQGRYQELEEREKEDEQERQAEEERNENPLPIFDDKGPDEFGFENDDEEDDDGPPQFSGDNQVPPIALDEEPVISSYEDLVRHHVETYLVGAQKFAQLTELSKRVSEWEDKIMPVLQNEEQFGYFDIHEYGTRVIDKLANKSENLNPITFKDIVSENTSVDVGRLFLASLQLANSGNVNISCETTEGVAVVDTMRLKLLQQERHHEQLVMYRAPSIVLLA
ncbi:condensin-2 complex subunit H2-like [Antedon mediterranea]|uniref:condensin-2 complex subunit H2-like n=1 Tax=Antedon mediterranea TaxID=105859 RepID=UPI003AF6C272